MPLSVEECEFLRVVLPRSQGPQCGVASCLGACTVVHVGMFHPLGSIWDSDWSGHRRGYYDGWYGQIVGVQPAFLVMRSMRGWS